MGFVWPRGSQGKTINIALTGTHGRRRLGGGLEGERTKGPRPLRAQGQGQQGVKVGGMSNTQTLT